MCNYFIDLITNPKSVKLYTFLILLFVSFGLYAQTFSVAGTVRDQEGSTVAYANVVLLNISDTTQVKGTAADEDGRFVLAEIVPNIYFIQARYFGYQSKPIPLDIKKDVQIGALLMDEDKVWLDEVVVTARLPSIERKIDRVVFNVENTIVSQGTSWDILRNTPGVVSVQDQLEIKGQAATIYLNDRKVQLSQSELKTLLEGLEGSMITSVEVIPNPPARYEAEGGPVLNIVTSKNIVPGYKGNFQATYDQAVFPKYKFSTGHYFKTENFGVFANYSVRPNKLFKETESTVNWFDPSNQVYARWVTDNEQITRAVDQQANLIMDYDIDDRQRLNLTSNLTFTPDEERDDDLNTIMRNAANEIDSTLNTLNDIRSDQLNLAVDLNYERDLKKEGSTLRGNLHYTYYEDSQAQDGSSDYFDPAGDFIRNFSFSTDAEQFIKIFTGQVDYLNPFEGGNWEAGAKLSIIRSDSKIDYFDANNGQPPFDIAQSDIFRYEEDIYAAYASYQKDWEKWALILGLRAEQTQVDGRSVTLDSLTTQDYFELFPNVVVQRKLGEDHSIALSYNRKVRRPKYDDLNPFRFFLNENDFVEGNPGLRPHFSNNFNLNFTFKDTYFVDFYYRDNGRYISDLSFQDNVNQTLRQLKQNVLESISYGIDLTMARTLLPSWYIYAYGSVFYENETFLAVESVEETFKNEVTGFYGYMSNFLTLSKDGSFTGEMALTYLSGFLNGSYQMSETINLNLGLRKTFLDNRLILSLVGEDLLGRANPTYTSRYFNQDNTYFGRPETRFFRVGVTLNFGNYKLVASEREIDKDERERIEGE